MLGGAKEAPGKTAGLALLGVLSAVSLILGEWLLPVAAPPWTLAYAPALTGL